MVSLVNSSASVSQIAAFSVESKALASVTSAFTQHAEQGLVVAEPIAQGRAVEIGESAELPQPHPLVKAAANAATQSAVLTPLDNAQALRYKKDKQPVTVKQVFNYSTMVPELPRRIAGFGIFMAIVPVASQAVKSQTSDETLNKVVPYSAASIVESTIMTPVSRIIFAKRLDQTKTFKELTQQLYKTGGVKGFWKGSAPLAVSSVIYNSLFYPTNEALQDYIKKGKENISKQEELLISFATGSLTSMAITPITNPFFHIVSKVRAQQEPTTFLKMGRQIVQESYAKGGLSQVASSLNEGVVLALGRSALSGGVAAVTLLGVQILTKELSKAEFSTKALQVEDFNNSI